MQGHVRAQEVIEGDKQGGESHGAIAGGKAAGGADMVLVGAVEAFDQLLEGAVLLGDGVAILETQDLVQGEGRLLRRTLRIEEVQARLISRIAVGNERERLSFGQGAGGLAQSDGSGQGIAFGRDMIGRDLMGEGIEEEETEVMFAGDPDIGFIAGGGIAEPSLVAEVEVMTVVGGGLGIVEDGLIAERHAEDLAQDLSGFASRQGKGDVEG